MVGSFFAFHALVKNLKIILIMIRLNSFNQRVSNTVQINTSTSQMLENQLNFGGNSQPLFAPSEHENMVIDIFRDTDYLYKSYDPILHDLEAQSEQNSRLNADNMNPLID